MGVKEFSTSLSDFNQQQLNQIQTDTDSIHNDTQTIINSDMSTLSTNVGSDADVSSATGSVHAKLKDLKSNISPIKSIQRGVVNTTSNQNLALTIASVNPNKCLVLFNGYWTEDANNNVGFPVLVSLTATVLTVTAAPNFGGSAYMGGYFSWQVIEYN